MFKLFVTLTLLFTISLLARDGYPSEQNSNNGFFTSMFSSRTKSSSSNLTQEDSKARVSATGMGVAPPFANSPAQAYALAKRAAMVDAYRLLAERIGGVKIEGRDTIKNMEVTRSEVRAYVRNSIKNAQIVSTKFKDGMCEVELEVVIYYKHFAQ